ncbi:MAG: RsmB/NOP family class I SAM-dependent RNA methyltransferase [Nanoarchaeota archaeon]
MQKINLKPLFEERMKKLLETEEYERYLKILKKPVKNYIRCNTLKISPEELKKRLEEKSWKISQPFKEHEEIMIIEGKFINNSNDNLYNNKNSNQSIDRLNIINNKTKNDKSIINNSSEGGWLGDGGRDKINKKFISLEPGELGNSLEHQLGYYYVQEIVSMLPILALNPKPNEIFLDLCASPGSKTTQAAAKMKNQGLIIANDAKLDRIIILASNLQRCGVSNAILTKKDGSMLCKELLKLSKKMEFDKILVDAPCSGEGTLRSSFKTYKMWNIKTISTLSRMQKRLVESAISILKKNGELIYSTCTHAPEENEEVVDFIIKNFPEMEIQKLYLPKELKTRLGITNWKDKIYSEKVKYSVRIYPQDNNTEGFFIAKFKKIK